jgi:hypothetical protein
MPTKYDPTVPTSLKQTQKWFASIIARPIDENSSMMLISPKGQSMEKEAKKYIAPSHSLKPHERIEIYNQQYWWRLLSVLQENFPLVTRLFGYSHFNAEIAFPYLIKYPPTHWSLNYLGEHLPRWIEEEYQANDVQLILNAAQVDWAFSASFIAKQHPHIDISHLPKNQNISCLLKSKLYLQPHVALLELDYDLFPFREKMIKEEGDYWIDHDFPDLHKEKKMFVLFRTRNNGISWNEITSGEFFLLKFFQQGISINKACEHLEKTDSKILEEASKNLHFWIQRWIIRHWLVMDSQFKC